MFLIKKVETTAKHYKIIFEIFNSDTEEYELESAWAEKVGEYYKLDNILFYARGYSWQDIVSVEERNGELYVTGLVQASGHSTIRILFNDETDVQPTREILEKMGCETEISNISILVSVDIPPTISYASIRKFLDKGEANEFWGYEEACLAHTD